MNNADFNHHLIEAMANVVALRKAARDMPEAGAALRSAMEMAVDRLGSDLVHFNAVSSRTLFDAKGMVPA